MQPQQEKKKQTKGRSVFCTLWVDYPRRQDYTEELFKEYGVKYFHCGAEERSEKNGELHHHAWIQFNKQISYSTVKKLLGQKQAHIEPRLGNVQQAMDYCDKPYTKTNGCKPVLVWGTVPKQGKRTDLLEMRNHFESGGKIKAALLDDRLAPTVIRHCNAARMLKMYFSIPRSELTELHIFYGPTGTGKSKKTFTEGKKLGSVYYKPPGKWWDGYEQQDTVIIDDFEGMDTMRITELFRLADRYPHRVQVKNGFEQFNSKRIYITTNIHPSEWYFYKEHQYKALARRTTKFHYLHEQLYEGDIDPVARFSVTLATSEQKLPSNSEKKCFHLEKPKLKRCHARSFNLKTKKVAMQDGNLVIVDIDDTDRCQSEETHSLSTPNYGGRMSSPSMRVPTLTLPKPSICHHVETQSTQYQPKVHPEVTLH